VQGGQFVVRSTARLRERGMDPEKHLSIIKKNTVEIVQEAELLRKIRKKGSLKVKFGVDPTTSDIHLGHSVVLLKLKSFQELGHQVILLIGDFTGKIGDPSGRTKTRKPLSSEEIEANAKTYREQAFKILDPERTLVLYNSQWLRKMSFSRVLKLASHYTVARMLERDDFQIRYQRKYPIGLHEFLYPLMQAYDSVALRADVEIGGTDQKFNLLLARQVQKSYGQSPQVIITMPILEGTDGKEKMSKSLGNYIGISEDPYQMYSKIMSIPDELIFRYFQLLTELKAEEISLKEESLSKGILHPKEAKKDLARRIVSFYCNVSSAKAAEDEFERVFAKGKLPRDIPYFPVDVSESLGAKESVDMRVSKGDRVWIIKLLELTGLAKTRSEARRLIEQGAVKCDGKKISDVNLEISLAREHVLQVGKRKFRRIGKKHNSGCDDGE
jgi:tyrosyl-tRNA synthetase